MNDEITAKEIREVLSKFGNNLTYIDIKKENDEIQIVEESKMFVKDLVRTNPRY